jgi:hypothetical protein
LIQETFYFSRVSDSFFLRFPYLCYFLFHNLCCLLYFIYFFFYSLLVSFWSLLKSSLSSFSCFCIFTSFLFVAS